MEKGSGPVTQPKIITTGQDWASRATGLTATVFRRDSDGSVRQSGLTLAISEVLFAAVHGKGSPHGAGTVCFGTRPAIGRRFGRSKRVVAGPDTAPGRGCSVFTLSCGELLGRTAPSRGAPSNEGRCGLRPVLIGLDVRQRRGALVGALASGGPFSN